MSQLFHFSDRGDIKLFHPRPPTGHPDSDPFVFAIDEWHSPLYYFPRDCPRTGFWPVANTSEKDVAQFRERFGDARMILAIQREFVEGWQSGHLFRYTFEMSDQWIDTKDHGCWVSQVPQKPIHVLRIEEFHSMAQREMCKVLSVEDLIPFTDQLRATSLHVSAIRHRLLPDFNGHPGTPVSPAQVSSKRS
ncbi:MAG: hypothetical protein KF812_06260 [Fimbriimonadaceae bacterium]|nr:hypothetical protein [Fimbriimonadaceae bacterium]